MKVKFEPASVHTLYSPNRSNFYTVVHIVLQITKDWFASMQATKKRNVIRTVVFCIFYIISPPFKVVKLPILCLKIRKNTKLCFSVHSSRKCETCTNPQVYCNFI